MLHSDKDQLSKVLGRKCDKRLENWLWFYLNHCNAGLPPNSFSAPDIRNRMAQIISEKSLIKNGIDFEQGRSFVSEESIRWITNDEILCNWLITYLNNHCGALDAPPRLIGRDLVIAKIDMWNVDIALKVSAISAMERDWNYYKKQDEIFNWFKGIHEDTRREYAWEWLSEHYSFLTSGRPHFSCHQDLFSFFDLPFFGSINDKIVAIEKIKKGWSQRQYRQNLKGKKQCNFILSERAINLLDKLAEESSLKRAQVLEVLINEEAKNGTYIAKRKKVIEQLLDQELQQN